MHLSDMYSVFLYFELSLSIRELRPRIPLLDYAKNDTLQKKMDLPANHYICTLQTNNKKYVDILYFICISANKIWHYFDFPGYYNGISLAIKMWSILLLFFMSNQTLLASYSWFTVNMHKLLHTNDVRYIFSVLLHLALITNSFHGIQTENGLYKASCMK